MEKIRIRMMPGILPKEYVVIKKETKDNKTLLTLLEEQYVPEYEISGLDQKGSRLITDETPVRIYPDGSQAILIVDRETGYGVGYCDIPTDDPNIVE